jgi:ribonuclease T1
MKRGVKTLCLILIGLLLWQPVAQAGFFSENASAEAISVAKLPLEARDTFRLVKQGGPFPYPRDGIVFSNREHKLPRQQRGYYHEYTVKTPGARNRGARRIVCGVVPECYYSDDHYRTFKRIKE